MRIIAGQRRGHKFDGPTGHLTRPTSDLVRESLFNILGPAVEGLMAIDFFAGTGALGLEALSRGASRAVFVEQNRANVALIRRNVATLRFEDRATILQADAFRWARGFQPVDDEPVLVMIDPPYREYENHPRRVTQLLSGLIEKLPAGSILALESSKRIEDEVLPDPGAWDTRRYGKTQLAILTVEREDPPQIAADEAETPTLPAV
jgi:16S rRNA (guanine966-N2)-methyltransferase